MARFLKALAILGLVLGLVAAAAVVWRHALVEAAARRALSANGLDEARLEVVEVGPAGLAVEDISLGPGLPTARRVELTYQPSGLLAGRLGTLTIRGARYAAPANLDAALAPLGALGAGGEGGWLSIPRVTIEDAVISLAAPTDGSVAIDGTLDLTGQMPGAALDIALAAADASGAFTVRSEALGEGGSLAIAGSAEAGLAGLPLPAVAGAVATGGSARLTLEGTARIPALDAGWAALREPGLASLDGTLRLSGVTSSLDPAVLSADLDWSLGAGDGSIRLTLPRPARMTVAGISPESLAALGLSLNEPAPPTLTAEVTSPGPLATWSLGPEGGAAELAANLTLALGAASAVIDATARAEHDVAWRLASPMTLDLDLEASELPLAGAAGAVRLAQARWSAAGTLGPDGGIALEGPLAAEAQDLRLAYLHAETLSAEGAVRLAGLPGRWSVAVAPDLAVVADAVAVPGRLTLSAPLRLAVERLGLETGEGPPRIDLLARADPTSGALLAGADELVAFTDAAGQVELAATLGQGMTGEVTLRDARATLPGHAIALSALTGSFPLSGAEDAPVSLAADMRDTGRTPRFAPLRLTLEGQRSGDAVTLSGAAETPGGALRLPLEAGLDLAAVTGRMTVGPSRIAFQKGLQPGALLPRLAALRDVAGAVRVTADLSLGPDGLLRSSAALTFEDLSARTGEVDVTGLSGRLRLAPLAPLATAGPQELTARSATVGVPLGQPRARFSAELRGTRLVVRLHEATGDLAGGTVAVGEALWDSAARSNAFEVRLRDVRLGQLLSDWHIEGISGTGSLSGVIPVSIGPAGAVIPDGRLEAAGPGVIRVNWGSARETLIGSGEQVALTVRALEDFRYDSLSVGIQQPADGALTLAVGLEGASPEVLDGYPFRFNITLSGQLAPILEAVREGRRIGTELLRGGLGGQ